MKALPQLLNILISLGQEYPELDIKFHAHMDNGYVLIIRDASIKEVTAHQ